MVNVPLLLQELDVSLWLLVVKLIQQKDHARLILVIKHVLGLQLDVETQHVQMHQIQMPIKQMIIVVDMQ